jgi:hypothetical protein
MDTDFIEKTIRNYAQTLKDGNQTEKEASEELAMIADKLKRKRQAENIESRPHPNPIPGVNQPTGSV